MSGPKYQHNPFIENFCYQLVAQKMNVEEMEVATIDQIAEDLYTRFESLLGRHIVESLPEEKRKEFQARMGEIHLQKDADNLDMVASIFGDVAVDAMEFNKILRSSLKDLTDEFLNS